MDAIDKLVGFERLIDAAGLVQRKAGRRLRFGDVAVALGYVTREDVQAALAFQRLEALAGKPHRLVGEILVSQGRLSRLSVSRVLEALVESAHRKPAPTAHARSLDWLEDLMGPRVA